MRNRAKCKLCNDTIESFHQYDLVICSCGEIGVDGGQDYFRVIAKDYNNFLRISDDNKEIAVTVVDVLDEKKTDIQKNADFELTKQDRINMLENMCKNIEDLPAHVINSPVSHYDLYSALTLILSIFRS